MIEAVDIRGFQRHVRLALKPGPGVTCVVGDTDAGKSSIIRAVIWALRNQPAGDDMVTHDMDQCSVSIRLSGGKITRLRGGGKNLYRLDGEDFVSFGQGVPEAIAVLAAVDDVNFQGQHDPPFWLGDSPGKAAREMNRIVDLSVIDRSLSNAQTALKRARIEHELAEKRSQEANGTLSSLGWVPGMLAALNVLNGKLEAVSDLHSSVQSLRGLIEKAEAIKPRARLSLPAGLPGLVEEIRRKRASIKLLSSLIEKAERHEELRCRAERSATAALGELSLVTECPLCGAPQGGGHPSHGS